MLDTLARFFERDHSDLEFLSHLLSFQPAKHEKSPYHDATQHFGPTLEPHNVPAQISWIDKQGIKAVSVLVTKKGCSEGQIIKMI